MIVTQDKVIAFEKRHGVRIPEFIKFFYLDTDVSQYGKDLISFWPFSEIAPVPDTLSTFRGSPDYGDIEFSLPGASSYFVFADWSIWCHVYAFQLTKDQNQLAPVVWIGNGKTWRTISTSFESFLQSYL